MKRTAFKLSVIFIAALFFASCANRNLSIEKRHYGKGYYVHANGKRDLKEQSKPDELSAITEVKQTAPVVNEPTVSKSEPAVTTITRASAPKKQEAKTNKTATKNSVAAPVRVVEKNSSADSKPVIRQESKKQRSASADDVDLVLIIILCFLLPPLAVYFSEGITTNFWIDVILTLLFWLPGIIFALIVCL